MSRTLLCLFVTIMVLLAGCTSNAQVRRLETDQIGLKRLTVAVQAQAPDEANAYNVNLFVDGEWIVVDVERNESVFNAPAPAAQTTITRKVQP